MSNLLGSLPILSYSFRPFFLLTGIYGVITVMGWVGFLFGWISLPLGWSPLHWHSHEMLFGLIPTAIAGFLLTAVCNWTGATPLKGAGLLALVLVWLAGRIVMWSASWWPASFVALIDLLFMPLLAIYMTRVLLQHANKRNLPIALMLLLLSLANLMMHIGFITTQAQWLQRGEQLAMGLIMLLMLLIGSRIIPMFTGNWLRNQGGQAEAVKSFALLETATPIVTVLFVVSNVMSISEWLTGGLALLAGVLIALRLIGWSGWLTLREPLLWILHLGYAWIAIALLLRGAAAFNLVPFGAWQHALGAGAMGCLMLGVMTRVSLGHTGRPLTLPNFGIVIYLAIGFAAFARVLAALHWVDFRWGLLAAAAAWSVAFSVFTLIYWPILTRPRVDGRLG
ncbi:MAG: NnrS family protein [Cellvibrio sp.]|nr:NnrS family protein [Cellvibrio sp.]